MRDAAVFFVAFYQVIEPFLSMAVVAMGWLIVAELRAHGYKATYASAIVRAMGAGVMAAQDRGGCASGAGSCLDWVTGEDVNDDPNSRPACCYRCVEQRRCADALGGGLNK
jgi:hypothetical protein